MAPWLELPYDITDVSPEENKIIKKCLHGYTKPFVKCGKRGYVMPGAFRSHAEEIYNLQVRPDDIWVITCPRSGTTWSQEMVWLLQNNLDYEAAQAKPLYDRFPMLEITSQVPEKAFELIKADFMNLGSFQGLKDAVRLPSWKALEELPSPRFIKTHLPLSMLPPKLLNTAKVFYVARDPRDVCVSYYYLHKMVTKGVFSCSFKNFWEAFRKDLLPWTPIIEHASEAWTQRHHPNLHFIYYENMLKDLPHEIRRACKFLGQEYAENDVQYLSEYLSFKNLKKNKNVNNTVGDANGNVQFLRKGESGGWKSHFDEKMELEADEFLTDRLRGLELAYPTFQLKECSYL